MSQNNEKLNRVAMIIAKIVEVFQWVAVALMVAIFVVFFVDQGMLKYLMNVGDGQFGCSGYTIGVLDEHGMLIPSLFLPTLILGILVSGMMAMIFRNINLIFKTTAGETKFAQGKTPFQPDNVRMLREIGIFAISIPVVEFVFDVLLKLVVGHELVESSISTEGIALGIGMLCLSQFFAYGMQLQADVDGLV